MIAFRLAALFIASYLTAIAAAAGSPQALHVMTAILPKGQVNKPYPTTSLVAGGTPPYVGQVSGSLPNGLSISSTGTLIGTPHQTGTFRFKVDMADSAGGTIELSYVLQIEGTKAPERGTSLLGTPRS